MAYSLRLIEDRLAANAAGVTGVGQTVAVLDTGVDYSVSALRGGGFPNAKVIGGMDAADEDNDPMDCDGHGTSVSGIIAGPARPPRWSPTAGRTPTRPWPPSSSWRARAFPGCSSRATPPSGTPARPAAGTR